jgi:FkbM family methyltransferase
VYRGETGLTGNIYCGLSDFSEMAFLLHLMRPTDVFVDVGANMGSYSLLASAAGASVVAFEPHPPTFDRLRQNLSLNSIDADLRCCGVGETSGSLKLTNSQGPMNQISDVGDDISVVTLDAAVSKATMIKVDVEGFELAVFRGAKRLLASDSLLAVIFEHSPHNGYGFNVGEIHEHLEELGFRPYTYEPYTRQVTPYSDGVDSKRITTNWIYARGDFRERLSSSRKYEVRGVMI